MARQRYVISLVPARFLLFVVDFHSFKCVMLTDTGIHIDNAADAGEHTDAVRFNGASGDSAG